MQLTSRSRAAWIVVLAVSLLTSASAAPSAASQRKGATTYPRPSGRERRAGDRVALRRKAVRVIRRSIAPGLRYTKIIDRRTPRRIFVLRADAANAPIAFDVTLAGRTLGYRATVPEMARRNGAVAAVNGDFSSRKVGRPIHAFVADGAFVQSGGGGGTFAVSADERRIYAGYTRQAMTALDAQTGVTWRIARWNQGPPAIGEIAAFSPAGGSLERPPRDSCSVGLDPTSSPRPVPDGPGLQQTFTIDRHACREDRMPVAGQVVLSAVAGTDTATNLMSLAVGTDVTLVLGIGARRAFDAIGGFPVLLHHRHLTAADRCTSWFCQAQPRTALGVQADGRLLFVVVDGRHRRYSLGLSLLGLARLMRQLGAVDAVNLDGGGASTMVIRGRVVNRPSDGSLRHVASAALVLRRPEAASPATGTGSGRG
jgi:hypothetical protein